MRVRELETGDEHALWALFRSTVHTINIRDYTQAQVQAWAPDNLDECIWRKKIHSIKPFLVESDGEIVGYSDLQPNGLIDHLFVHHQWQRKGVGRTLMQEIEKRACRNGIKLLKTHASVTARPFFEAFGFTVINEQILDLHGEKLRNFVMQRKMLCA